MGACNIALHAQSKRLAGNAGVSAEEAAKEWAANVIPGITIIPSGTWGVNRAQEQGARIAPEDEARPIFAEIHPCCRPLARPVGVAQRYGLASGHAPVKHGFQSHMRSAYDAYALTAASAALLLRSVGMACRSASWRTATAGGSGGRQLAA